VQIRVKLTSSNIYHFLMLKILSCRFFKANTTILFPIVTLYTKDHQNFFFLTNHNLIPINQPLLIPPSPVLSHSLLTTTLLLTLPWFEHYIMCTSIKTSILPYVCIICGVQNTEPQSVWELHSQPQPGTIFSTISKWRFKRLKEPGNLCGIAQDS
jgi:hypothetical protein